MATLLRILKHAALHILCFSGILWILAAIRMRDRAVILTYHRVLPYSTQLRHFSTPSIVVSPETFDWQMRLVRRFLRPVSFSDFINLISSGRPIPSRTCLITFDDGWYDNLTYALPILRQHGIPFLVFVTADFVGTDNCFWQETIARLFFESRDQPSTQETLARLCGRDISEQGNDAVKTAIYDAIANLKNQPKSTVDALLAELGCMAHRALPPSADRFLSWDELHELAADRLVSIGSHARSHTPLTKMSLAEATREMNESRVILQDRLRQPISALAYPNGDCNPNIAKQAQAAGFLAAFTTARGYVRQDSNRWRLPRYNISDPAAGTLPKFLGRLAGLT